MARINLLPWRAERRKQRQREFYAMLGLAAVGGLLLSLMVWFYYDRQVSGQGERNTFLQAEIEKVKLQNKEIDRLDSQKERLLARKTVIEELQSKRSQMVHLFDALVRTIPDGVVLTALKQEDDVLTLEGRTQSNARVSAYMRNLATSGWMTNPELSIIEARDPGKEREGRTQALADISALPYVFVVKVKLPAQSEEVLNADGSVADPGDAGTVTDPEPLAPLSAADGDAADASPAATAAPPSEGGVAPAPPAPTPPAGSRLAPVDPPQPSPPAAASGQEGSA